ncbi:TPA: NAD-dependent epimerase/dehydratase family protein [Candidatus Woesearchaeota archaeon]|nr:NAD-dependent epimerase/dehydratase family protein [Candidatus Woesearchaeota archaeon]
MHVVTGGSGFIGRVLVQKLLARGEKVKVIDLAPPPFTHPSLSFVKKSVLDDLSPELRGCVVLYHFAALLGVENSDNHPLQTLEVNLIGSRNVFRTAVEQGVKKVVFSSSSEVYGEPRELPIKEETAKGPVSTYGVSKLAAEMYALAYARELKTEFHIVRFFNVYGPGQQPQFVIPLFIRNALDGKPLRVYGEGKQTRCFTYVDDAIDGVLTVLEKGKPGEAYNIGNDRQTTILELAELVIKASGRDIKPELIPFGRETRLEQREINYRQPDISKMKSLGWKPKIFVEEGVQKTLGWMKTYP